MKIKDMQTTEKIALKRFCEQAVLAMILVEVNVQKEQLLLLEKKTGK